MRPKIAELVRDCLSAKHMRLVNMSMGCRQRESPCGRTRIILRKSQHSRKKSCTGTTYKSAFHRTLRYSSSVYRCSSRMAAFSSCSKSVLLILSLGERLCELVLGIKRTRSSFYLILLTLKSRRPQPNETHSTSHQHLLVSRTSNAVQVLVPFSTWAAAKADQRPS